MAQMLERVCTIARWNNAFKSNIAYRLQAQEMNKLTLLLVFICGVVFALILPMLKETLLAVKGRSSSLGVLPAGVDIDLMDDGYVAMNKLSPSDGETSVTRKQTTELEDKNAETEALNTLKAAVELVDNGKAHRAGRLLHHAYNLAPLHPDVLVHYGEYHEHFKNDIVRADHLYLRALTISPANWRALRNRRRTRPLVEELDADLLERIDDKRNELMLIPSSSAALKRIKKEAYFHYIYHTAGIEGNTMTLAQTRMILETRLSVGGKSVMEHNEILGLDLALKFINTTLVHRVGKISLQDILEIHRRVLGHIDPIGAGYLRTTQVYVSNHVPPSPTRLQILMEDFVAWLNSEDAQKLHPIKYASLAHYKLVFIHPFVDGNGRTARLLMNFLLMQAGYPPVIIRKQDRMQYYEHLQTANLGDTRPFVRFIADCTEKTLDVYLWATKDLVPEIEEHTHDDGKTSHSAGKEMRSERKHETPHIIRSESIDISGESSDTLYSDGNVVIPVNEEEKEDDEDAFDSWTSGDYTSSGNWLDEEPTLPSRSFMEDYHNMEDVAETIVRIKSKRKFELPEDETFEKGQ
ncbi:FIC domain protein adenylyltransferase [Oratosquilla oratoria]|uniref:FIC domain protein adenylyltransferase n=1 Tax=Oratosquilla oratoria TaxID=337810 RepID=UPI003F764BE6